MAFADSGATPGGRSAEDGVRAISRRGATSAATFPVEVLVRPSAGVLGAAVCPPHHATTTSAIAPQKTANPDASPRLPLTRPWAWYSMFEGYADRHQQACELSADASYARSSMIPTLEQIGQAFYPEHLMPPEYRDEPCRTALNRVRNMPFKWSLNPYMGCAHQCTFCFVRAFERIADRPSDDRYGTSIRVKTNVVEVLTRELGRKSWRRETVVVGTATDPYQPAEGRFRLTRGSIVALGQARTPFSFITRGPMIVRDVDVLSDAAKRASVSITFSIPTLDHDIWSLTEPGTAPPRQRLRAIRTLVDAGIKAGVGMAPILPGLSDRPELLENVVKAARDAGATFVWANVLYLRPGTREHFLDHLARDWPELLPQYESMYEGRAYIGRHEVEPVKRTIAELRVRYGIADRRTVKLEPGAESPEPSAEQLPLGPLLEPPGSGPLVPPGALPAR